MIIERLNQEQMVEQMEASLNKLRLRLAWTDHYVSKTKPTQTVEVIPEFVCTPEMHSDTIATLIALGVKSKEAEKLAKSAVGTSVGERIASCLRHR